MATVGTDSQDRVIGCPPAGEGVRVDATKALGFNSCFESRRTPCLPALSRKIKSYVVWDVDTGRPVLSMEQPHASAMCFSTDGKVAATAAIGMPAWIWAPPSGDGLVNRARALSFSSIQPRWASFWRGQAPVSPEWKVVTKETGGTAHAAESGDGHVVWSFNTRRRSITVGLRLGWTTDSRHPRRKCCSCVGGRTGRERPSNTRSQNWFARTRTPGSGIPPGTPAPTKAIVSVSPGAQA